MKNRIMIGVLLAVVSNTSVALENFTGKVVSLEPTYLPGNVAFVMDAGNTTCPAGSWLKWQKPDTENNKAVYAALLTALTAGRDVRFFINDGDVTCTGQFLHLN